MNDKSIWIGEKDLNRDEAFLESLDQEFATPILENGDALMQTESKRRDFLKFLGFSVGAATVAAGCDVPIKRAIPYVEKPDSIVPGVATYYASSYVAGGDYCPILVKCREGRPIKVEGNDRSSMTNGGTSARAQASVLSLYDTNRYKAPFYKEYGQDDNGGEVITITEASWDSIDNKVKSVLAGSKNIRIITNTILSPSENEALNEFKAKYPQTKVVTYDPVSASALLEANEMSFGDRVIPSYHFDKADMIVSFNADFLGTWVSPVEFAYHYSKNRKINAPGEKMSRHVQVESHMSMTGSNADHRVLVRPSELGSAIAYLHSKIAGGSGGNGLNDKAKAALNKVASQLTSARGKSLVVSGSNNVYEQILVNDINNILGNYGGTITFGDASLQRRGNEKELDVLVQEMQGGLVDTIIVYGSNPAYDYAQAKTFVEALGKVKNKIAVSYQENETSALCDIIAPTSHFMESWGDAQPKRGTLSLIQPAINTIFETRQSGLTLLNWAGSAAVNGSASQPYLEFIKNTWKNTVFANQSNFVSFTAFWENALRDGVVNVGSAGEARSFNVDVGLAKSRITKPSGSDLEVVFYEPVSIGNGLYSTNPWLMEMPDPVARTSWGNYLAVPLTYDGSKKYIGKFGLNDGDLAEITINGKTMTVPVILQFGMEQNTVALALGYGREVAGKCGTDVGVNVNDCVTHKDGFTHYFNNDVAVSGPKGKEKHFSCVQYFNTIGVKSEDNKGELINADEATLGQTAYGVGIKGYQGSLTERTVIFPSNLSDLAENVEKKDKVRASAQHLNEQTLYPFDEYTADKYSQGHYWGMHVDLNACIGCNACTVACMAENNVPVVGKKEVSRHHEMTWLRIDRYYYGDFENPNTVYQPMMCQHCDNAPCENVCPVNATNHSSEGLNQMAYNRCVGTRYCANNCPYKVRRFNWLDYTTADIFPANQPTLNGEEIPFGADNLTRMVLNPDVTVRARGVIEKCSFCVQRIQEGKLTAKIEGRRLEDIDVRTACQTACPTGAITFGDRNNKNGDLGKKLNPKKNKLNYIALEEVNVQSSVTYTMKVTNRDESIEA